MWDKQPKNEVRRIGKILGFLFDECAKPSFTSLLHCNELVPYANGGTHQVNPQRHRRCIRDDLKQLVTAICNKPDSPAATPNAKQRRSPVRRYALLVSPTSTSAKQILVAKATLKPTNNPMQRPSDCLQDQSHAE